MVVDYLTEVVPPTERDGIAMVQSLRDAGVLTSGCAFAPARQFPHCRRAGARIREIFLAAIVCPEETTANASMIGGHFFIAKPASLSALTERIEEFSQE